MRYKEPRGRPPPPSLHSGGAAARPCTGILILFLPRPLSFHYYFLSRYMLSSKDYVIVVQAETALVIVRTRVPCDRREVSPRTFVGSRPLTAELSHTSRPRASPLPARLALAAPSAAPYSHSHTPAFLTLNVTRAMAPACLADWYGSPDHARDSTCPYTPLTPLARS